MIEGPPALVVEILSPSTASRDKGPKARRYALAGIQHYWIVDIERQRIDCLRLSGPAYAVAVAGSGPCRIPTGRD